MSGPYVYTPSAYDPTPYLEHGAYTQRSPFIPPATLFPSSPYAPSSPPHLAPNTPQGVYFDDSYWTPHPRARRPSWHAGMMPPGPFLQAPSTPGHHRRRSFGEGFRPSSYEPASPWSGAGAGAGTGTGTGTGAGAAHVQIHPLLNGDAPPRTDFYFDLASPSFSPLRWIGPGRSAVVSVDELREPATYPAVTRMRVSHDALPRWPIDLQFRCAYDGYAVHTAAAAVAASQPQPPPITLGDVLYAIHSSVHRRITHQDWARLSLSEETAVARAYTRRCRRVPSAAQAEASQGVKRVDYLLDKHIFRGLVRTHDEDGFYRWRMITA